MSGEPKRILIVGGGYVGMYTALRAQRKLSRRPRRDRGGRPAAEHDLPAVPARGGGRQRRATACGGAAAPGAEEVPGDHRQRHPDRARSALGHHPAGRRAVLPAGLRPAGGGARFDRADAADPGPGRAGHRLQDHRRGDLPAQPRAVPAGLRLVHRGCRGPGQGVDASCSSVVATPGWRRWPNCRTWLATPAGTTRTSSRRPDALGAGRGRRPDHARGVGVAGRLHGGSVARAQHGRPAEHPAELRGRWADRAQRRRELRGGHPGLDRGGEGP